MLNSSDDAATSISSCYVGLSFAANGTNVNFTVELAWPRARAMGGGGVPIMMTQWNHRAWGLLAVQRGYTGLSLSHPLTGLPHTHWPHSLTRLRVALSLTHSA